MVIDSRALCTDDQIYPYPHARDCLADGWPTPPDLFSKFPHLHRVSIHDLERRNESERETHGPGSRSGHRGGRRADDIGSLRLRRAHLLDPDGLSSQRANPVVRWETLDLRPGCPCVQPGTWSSREKWDRMAVSRSRVEPATALPRVSTKCASNPSLQPGTAGRAKKGAANLPFPAKYADDTTSDLKVTVKPGENNLEPIKLVPGPSAAKSASRKGLNQRD